MCFVFLFLFVLFCFSLAPQGLSRCPAHSRFEQMFAKWMNEWMNGLEDLWNTSEIHFCPWEVYISEVTWVVAGCLAGSVHFILLIVNSCPDQCSAATTRNEQSSSFNHGLTLSNVEPVIFRSAVFSLLWLADMCFLQVTARFTSQKSWFHRVPPYS